MASIGSACRLAAAMALAACCIAGCGDDRQQPVLSSGGSGGIGGDGGSGGSGGTAGTGGTEGNEPPDGCTALTLGANLVMSVGGPALQLEAKAMPGLDGAYRTHAVFELHDYDPASGEARPLETGTFDLAEPPDDGYATCQHCTLLVAYARDGMPQRYFFQSSGEVEITKVGQTDEDRGIAAATLRDVQLREIVQTPDFGWADAPGDECYWIDEWSFDTTPNNGAPCERAEDCANTALQVCDPQTGRCASHQCSFTGDVMCPAGQICVSQIPTDPSWGACYRECTPFIAGECGVGEICVPFGPTQTTGACKKVGTGRLGEACDEPDLSTGCVFGAICAGDPAVCTQLCRYLSAEPGCPQGQVCGIDNVCVDPATGDPARLGEQCDPSSPVETGCGADGKAFAGLCLSLFPEVEELTCYEMCRTADSNGCGAGSYCATLFANPEFGLCWDDPVCGDGAVDPLNEVCDDGGTVANDGCNANCTAAEFAPLCDAAPPLALDETIAGTTVGGPTGYVGSCRIYQVVPAATYRFVPPGPGTLSLALASSEANLDLLVLGDCADPESQLGCHSLGEATEQLDVDFAEAGEATALVVVAGSGIRDAGAFELQAHFVPAVCGDGVVAGPEVCDDGGTASGDGCSGDCLAIEWPVLCAALPQLSTDALNEGDTTTADDFQAGALVCAGADGDDTEVMYRYRAPRAGRLTLRLAGQAADHVLYVLDGCGPAQSWEELLGCSNSGRPGGDNLEQLQVSLAAGQQITVVVEGFLPGQRGPFALEATFE